jgi:hypothetical protein
VRGGTGAGAYGGPGGSYYTYRNDASGEGKGRQDPGYFEPGEIAKAEGEKPPRPEPEASPKKTKEKKPKQQPGRKVIREGEMEFEIEGFDSTVAKIVQIAGEEGGFIATINSEKLPNGKVRGTVVVRVPPDRLDTLVLKLRALGELKSRRLGSQDITKMYTDLESRLRAARAMEERLIRMIKEEDGEIKDLLQAEKELGTWRTKIEQLVGEIRYYNNLVSLATLTITLYEKEIRSAHGVTETERVEMGIEVDEVEKAYREALKAVDEAKGRVTKSELKQHDAGQYSALIEFETKPEAAGPLRDRLSQLGTVARLDIRRGQKARGGQDVPHKVEVEREDTKFSVSLYNLANVQARETVHIDLACKDAEETYKAILKRIDEAGGRVVASNLDRQRGERTTGQITFEIKAADAEAVQIDVRAQGEVMRLQVTENPNRRNVTEAKRGFVCRIFAMGTVAPRETTTIALASKDVAASYHALLEVLKTAGARVLSASLNERDRQNVTASLDFEVSREREKEVNDALAAAGDIISRTAQRTQAVQNVVDSKTRLSLSLMNLAVLAPRETQTLAIEVGDVDEAVVKIDAILGTTGGRLVDKQFSRERSGRVVARIVMTVPLRDSVTVVAQIKSLGTVRVVEASRNPRVPDSDLAVARLDVTVSNADLIIPSDEGFWATIRSGLGTSFQAISYSLMLIIIGVCVILPWALIVWILWKLYRRFRPRPVPAE